MSVDPSSVVGFVMAGGAGSRLCPLTAHRCKPVLSSDRQPHRGTADAAASHLAVVEAKRPEHVAAFGADHIYRMGGVIVVPRGHFGQAMQAAA